MLNTGKRLFCAFIDFSKAFGYVVRDNLWTKLIKLGVIFQTSSSLFIPL